MSVVKRISLCCFVFSVLSGWCVQTHDLSRDGVEITVESLPGIVDVARDFEVHVTMTAPAGKKIEMPDLRDRFTGFRVAEDFAEEPLKDAGGRTTFVTRWRLVPEAMAGKYRLAPFVVTVTDASGKANSFYTSPIVFTPPAERESASGEMEVSPTRDFPPLSWRLAGIVVASLAGVMLVAALVYWIVRKIKLMVKIHRMSPIERAMYELDALIRKGLPGRGFFKDFYVELTMVVRRYIERRHAVRAPNLTTEEFLRAAQDNSAFTPDAIAELRSFLESADMVKFAGVEATPEMADSATDRAKNYLHADSREVGK